MIVLGLTGSVGMGKSTVAAMFRRLDVPVFDADAVVHALQGPGGALVAAVEAAFPGTTGAAGVDRRLLGAAVLDDRAKRTRLERLIHPAVDIARRDFLRRHRAHPLVVLDIPLLFEKGGWRRVHKVAVVSAPLWVQRRRVMARPGMTAARFRAILAAQLRDAQKRARADILIETGTTIHETARQIRRIAGCLGARRVRYDGPCAKSSSIPKPPA